MRIGVYGGTFNPPHIGHINAAVDAEKQLGLDKVFIIPSAIPPHKDMPEASPSAEDRLQMAKMSFEGISDSNLEVSDIEIKRGGKSYTIDTIAQLKRSYPGSEFVLFIGTDMLVSIESWRDYERLLENVVLGVFCRGEDEKAIIEKKAEYLREKYNAQVEIVHNDAVKISSSDIRAMLPKRGGNEYLNGDVYEYIIHNGLYDSHPNFDWLRFKSYKMLKLERIAHVAGCEAEAVSLAKRWGADADLAREAAILHDCTKKAGLEEQLRLCRKYGIITDIVEKHEVKLLHSKTGAAIAKNEFNACEDVFNAIFWHTTGKADMSLLEKVIYLADYIEPNRHFDGLEELRRLSYKNIDAALLMGLKMSIDDMRSRGIVPHENSEGAINWLVENYQHG